MLRNKQTYRGILFEHSPWDGRLCPVMTTLRLRSTGNKTKRILRVFTGLVLEYSFSSVAPPLTVLGSVCTIQQKHYDVI